MLADERQKGVAASVNGDVITTAQLDAVVREQLEALETRARQIRQSALNKLIDNLLLEQAARADSVSTADYLRRHVESAGVSAEEVDEAYERSRQQFPGVLAAEAKYRIRRSLEDNRRAAALNTILERLRREARVANHLMEDRWAALEVAAQEGPSLGPAEAAVTIVEFADFECRFCRTAQPALKRVLARWPGQVRLVFRHFPLEQHATALPAAQAAACAESQGRFWEMHDRIFEASGPLSDGLLRSAAKAAALNIPEFDRCMKGEEALERVRRDALLGRNIGVAGTPAFYVNRQPVGNAAELEAAVERILGGDR
jgi:predicted DsbA family dithiol-disulfide isomerase